MLQIKFSNTYKLWHLDNPINIIHNNFSQKILNLPYNIIFR